MSRDPASGYIGEPLTLHKYLYAGGDPVNRTDPRGREAMVDYGSLLKVTAMVVGAVVAYQQALVCLYQYIGSDVATWPILAYGGKQYRVGGCVLMAIYDPEPWSLREWLDNYLDTAPPPAPLNPKCQLQYDQDVITCGAIGSGSCYAQAMARFAACLAGRQIPPFNF